MAKTRIYRCVEMLIAKGPMTTRQISDQIFGEYRNCIREPLLRLERMGYVDSEGAGPGRLYKAVGHLPPEDGRGKNAANFKGARGGGIRVRPKVPKHIVHQSTLAQALAWNP